MTRALASAVALALFAIPLVAAPNRYVLVTGMLGMLLAAVGIGGLWRWPVTAAACVFALDYAAALWVARAPVSVGAAVAFGLALLLLPASVELGRSLRGAAIEARVVWSQIGAWLGFAVATLATTLLGLAVAGGLATSIPFAAAPFVAALAALGAVLALAAIVRKSR
jgi:hypothetical protein